ncbi:unnamed protein product [marine sediment metagenome]|uniref:Uncharacterized protein n=1 Tax=marine sediment metagenome TaxID=412755 RepID=X1H7Y8_9ZZZZ
MRVGDVFVTSYQTGPFVADEIFRDCDCPEYLDWINNYEDAKPSKKHIHIVCHDLNGRKNCKSYVYGYDEETLTSVWDDDSLSIIGNKTVQAELF